LPLPGNESCFFGLPVRNLITTLVGPNASDYQADCTDLRNSASLNKPGSSSMRFFLDNDWNSLLIYVNCNYCSSNHRKALIG